MNFKCLLFLNNANDERKNRGFMDIRFHRRLRGEYFQNGGRACHAAAQQNSKDDLGSADNFVLVTFSVAIILKLSWRYWFHAGVNKKPKKFKTVWHGFRGI